jgi:hypothetical protein
MRRALAAAITLTATAVLASGATLAAAQTSAPAAARRETFRIITVQTSGRHSVLATGDWVSGGYLAAGRLIGGYATDRIVFPRGSFRFREHVTSQWLPLPTTSCMIRETIRGNYTIYGGRGVWRHLTGSGRYVTRMTGVLHRSKAGKCGGSMSAYQSITSASGPVHR